MTNLVAFLNSQKADVPFILTLHTGCISLLLAFIKLLLGQIGKELYGLEGQIKLDLYDM